ncbi:MAG TPA: hypothetical protein VHM24_01665 [Gemmatimonadaceae bacterium]|nr:hypothetical protein [Gemmatimonadaceae bacterium]
MPKSALSFNPTEYALVATRITLFYERYPTGRIETDLISRDRDVVFKASVYRSDTDACAAATGWASEREGDGEVNEFACLENTETSAIGRALANLGFTAALKRPSREEMEKVARARSRPYRSTDKSQLPERVAEGAEPSYGPHDTKQGDVSNVSGDRLSDVIAVVLEAVKRGMPRSSLEQMEQRYKERTLTADELLAMERRARQWLLHGGKAVTRPSNDTAPASASVNTPSQ